MSSMLATEQDVSWGHEHEGAMVANDRTCVGCRSADTKGSLVRVVRGPQGQIVPDPMGRLPGRGAYVHVRGDCMAAAVRGGLARAFRAPVELGADELAVAIEARLVVRRTGLLVAARRAGALAIGTDAVRDAIASRRVALLLVASDAAGRREELSAAVGRLGRACVEVGTKTELGALLGREEVGVVAVLDRGLAEAIASVSTDIAAASAARLAPRVDLGSRGRGADRARSGGRTPR
ncbi:MAG: DUF448 domain-containing protein [Deltaproteobacteria bacterium]|nr:DUF448 domain-containing protein [Deltaproteobacteria bacterium]